MAVFYESVLPSLPVEEESRHPLDKVSFKFRDTSKRSEMEIVSGRPHYTRDLTEFWQPFREEGPRHMQGHFGYLSVAIPCNVEMRLPATLHVAVCYVTMQDLLSGRGEIHRQDFDRLMDITNRVFEEMVEAGLLSCGERSVKIIAEPLTPKGALRLRHVRAMGRNIRDGWLNNNEQHTPFFNGHVLWDSFNRRWRGSSQTQKLP